MTTLSPRPSFDWTRVRWDAADAPQRDDCSYCGAAIPEEAVPLRMWDASSNACVFCAPCAERWFGLEADHDEPSP
ncbi:MAG TPA: hypothetical protein VKY24_00735 [Reyranella sp.]|nr:hypothetical protein [Reyranella sp.]